ncbi:MAG: EAL domain-containing protein [Steroidobacteraceae bacterium]
MTRPAPAPSNGPGPLLRPAPAALDEALRRVQSKLDAALVAIRLEGGVVQSLARDVAGARVLEDLWRHGGEGLMEQVRAASDGLLGTNRLRAVRNGPVCGKLVAAALRDASGSTIGVLVAMRSIDQPKLGPEESQLMVELAAEVRQLYAPASRLPVLLSWSTFQERARAEENSSNGLSGCILYGNLDQLHVLNKLAGLAAGDQAIAAVGMVLEEQPMPDRAGVCHISGDRFAAYLPKTSLAQARRVAEQLCRAVGERCAVIGGVRTRLSISFGVASVSPGDLELTQVIAAAETACRTAKDRGRARVEVYQDTDTSMIQRSDDVLIATKLRRSLETERFGIVAQPLVPLTRAAPGGEYFELLVRLLSDTGSFVSPAHFMSAATRYQMLIDLDRAMLMRVFERLKGVREQFTNRAARFSLNLSGPTIGNPDFLEWLCAQIGPEGVPGEMLQFEITETAAVANVPQTQTLIRHLRARGVEFALDDFGTGVSSLAYLKSFDVSMLKLDGSFTHDLLTDVRSESLVRGVAQLARSMGIQSVAECVESETVRQRLLDIGVDRAQGFLFGQPVPLESILKPAEVHKAPQQSVAGSSP